MTILTEPIGSIPRPLPLIEALARLGASDDPCLDLLYEDAIRATVERLEAAGSPVITGGEKRKYHNFRTYCVHALPDTAPDGLRDRVIEASGYIPMDRPGTTDDCGFWPFSNDTSTSRDTAFAKIRARVLGTHLAERMIAER